MPCATSSRASDSVGCAWMLRATSSAVRSQSWAKVSSGSSSVTSGPIMWTPRISPYLASAPFLTTPVAPPSPCALPLAVKGNLETLKVSKFPFTANGKAHGLGGATGVVKKGADAKYGEILGVHMIGPDVTELLPELTLAQLWDLTAEEVARNIHAHPTLSEALLEVAHGISGHMINA